MVNGERNPWDSVPPERRLDFRMIGRDLATLAEATVLKVQREWPRHLAAINGANVVVLLLTKLAVTTYSTIRYFCAEIPEDQARQISFASSAPPLLRTLLEEIFAVIFIRQDPPGRVAWYHRAGWREKKEYHDRHVQQYGADPAWREWLEEYQRWLDWTAQPWGITPAEIQDPATLPRWPIPSRMLNPAWVGPQDLAFLRYLMDWFYREFSQESHLSLPGLISRGSTFLRPIDDPLTEPEWRKKRSDWFNYAVILLLAFLSEITAFCGFDLLPRCAYLWGVIDQYSPIAEELFAQRYRALTNP